VPVKIGNAGARDHIGLIFLLREAGGRLAGIVARDLT
jgi:hypothetical protein